MSRPRRRRVRRLWGRGSDGERGAVAVAVALLVPILLIASGLAVDTAASWMARNQVVTGADAAALGQAVECAEGNCGTQDQVKARASHYFIANNTGSKLATLQPGTGWIQYDTGQKATRSQGTWQIRHLFGAALGVTSSELTVESMARWSGLPSATADLPVALSYCVYAKAVGRGLDNSNAATTVPLETQTGGASCKTPGGTNVTGTSVLTAATGSSCTTASQAGGTVAPTSTAPAGCSAAYLNGLVGRDIVVALYDQGSPNQVRIYGYAALRVTSVSTASPGSVTGYFTYLARQITTPSSVPTAPDLGARAVFLWDPDTWQGTRCPC